MSTVRLQTLIIFSEKSDVQLASNSLYEKPRVGNELKFTNISQDISQITCGKHSGGLMVGARSLGQGTEVRMPATTDFSTNCVLIRN